MLLLTLLLLYYLRLAITLGERERRRLSLNSDNLL